MEHRSSSRCKKPVNYGLYLKVQTEDDMDDHDFAFNSSDNRSTTSRGQQKKPKKKKLKAENQHSLVLTSQKLPSGSKRVSLDEKIFERDLMVAIEQSKQSIDEDDIKNRSVRNNSYEREKADSSARLSATSECTKAEVCEEDKSDDEKSYVVKEKLSNEDDESDNSFKTSHRTSKVFARETSPRKVPGLFPSSVTQTAVAVKMLEPNMLLTRRNESSSSACHKDFVQSSTGLSRLTSSPTLGLRLGLSRNVKIKSLHNVIKTFK